MHCTIKPFEGFQYSVLIEGPPNNTSDLRGEGSGGGGGRESGGVSEGAGWRWRWKEE